MNKSLILILGMCVIFLISMLSVINAATNISSCGQNINASGSYVLNQSITSTATCLTTNSSNVEIDCAGNTITYGTAGTANSLGIKALHSTTSQVNLTIKNCILIKTSAGGSGGNGIMLTRFANSTIVNNTISVNGVNANRGIYILETGSTGNNISRNTIVTSGTSTTNYGIYLSPGTSDSIIEYNNITTGKGTATTDNYGIRADDPRVNITSNIIYTFGSGDSNHGIYSYTSTSTRIVNNTIYTSGTTGNNRGIFVSSSDFNLIANNTINTTGQASPGIYLSTSNSVNILNNRINSTADAIYITSNVLSDFTLANITRDNTRYGRNITVYGGGALNLPCPDNTVIDNPADGALKFFGCNNITVQNWYRPNRDTDGLLFVNSDNNTIINNTINGGLEGLDMVNTAGQCDNNLIANNTFSSFGYLDSYGAYAIHIYGNNNTITNNNLSTSGIASGNIGIDIQNDFNNITNNIITTAGTSGNIGIYLESRAINNLIQNNTINTSGTSGNTGIYFVDECTGNIVRNNTITATGTTSGNLGIRLISNSNSNFIEYNTFYTKGLTTANNGIDFSSSSNNTVRFNNVYAGYVTGTTDNDAISLVGSSRNNTFTNNILFANGTSTSITSDSIYLQSSSTNNTFANNVIIKSVGNSIVLDMLSSDYPSGNIFQNNSLNNVSGSDLFFLDANINNTFLINQPIGKYNFTGIGGTIIVENTQFGKINFTSLVNGSGTNMSADIEISANFAQVNPSKPGLNATANISFYNISTNFYNPIIKRDGIYECNSMTVPACLNFTSLNAGNVSFSVTGWSNYSITNQSDMTPPQFANYTENPANGSSYVLGQTYRFNATITDQSSVNVWIEWQGTNYTNGNITNSGNVYSFLRNNLAAGTYSYKWWANDTSGFLNSSNLRDFTINKAVNSLTLSSSAGWNYSYGISTTLSCSAGMGASKLYLNDLEISNPKIITLSVGSYAIKCNVSESQNYSASSLQQILNVTKQTTNTTILATPTSPINYGTTSNFSCSNSASLPLTLYINGQNKTDEINQLVIRPTGEYTISCNSTENENYTDSSQQATYTIEKSIGDIRLYLNSQEDNVTIQSIEYSNITSTTLYGNVSVYLNGTDITAENGLNILRSTGYYNVTAFSLGDENHSSESKTLWLNVTLDSILPSLSIILPQDGATYGNNESLALNFSVYDVNLDSCWFYVFNSTNEYEVINTTLPNCQNTTFNVSGSGSYTLSIYANDSYGNLNEKTATFTVNIGAPSISLVSPLDNSYLNYNNVELKYIPSDTDLLSCELWGDFDGDFKLNQTSVSLVNGVENTFLLYLSDRVYRWNIRCTDSAGHSSFNGNKTFYVDTTAPSISLTEPIGTKTLRTGIPIQFSIIDASPTTCWYNVKYTTGQEVLGNTTINCSLSSFGVSTDGDYVLNFYVNDSAGNSNTSSSSFTISTSNPPIINGGGGGGSSGDGGGGSSGISPLNSNLSIGDLNSLTVDEGGVKKIVTWKVKNNYKIFLNDCKFKSLGKYSSWISHTETKGLAAGEEYNIVFDVNIPENVEMGSYEMGVSFTCRETNKSSKFNVEVLGKQLEFKMINAERSGNDKVKIDYSIKDVLGKDQNVEVQFLLFDMDNKKVAEVKESKLITANSEKEFQAMIPIDESLSGELSLLINLNSETYSGFVQENIVLGSPISGFAIFDSSVGRNTFISAFLIILFLVFAFFVIRRIKGHRKVIRHEHIRSKYALQ